ncbi:MAG: Gfo/Idh/MocA family protein [Planctomycetota bacterium]|jgi:predicted dehydrogenase
MRRRDFLRKSAGVFSLPYLIPSRVLGMADRPGRKGEIKVGFIGFGRRAGQLVQGEGVLDHSRIVAVADCYLPRCDDLVKLLPEGQKKVNKYQDYRRMLDKERLDAVYVATTTHARALICIHAMKAGLDVYAEKPISLTVEEGRALVKVARKYKRVFQAGTQQRSMPINIFGSKLVREGAIGKVHTVIAHNFVGPVKWVPKPGQPMPTGMDWDKWCHQTEFRPYHKKLYNGWSRWWAYDGGGVGWGVTGWGTHALDQVQCALGTDLTGPVEIWPDGADDTGRVKVTMRYANGTLLKMCGPKRKYEDLGAIFMGDKGKIEIIRGKLIADPSELLKDSPPEIKAPGLGEGVDHTKNFFDCMGSRKLPNADVEIAHRSTTVCTLMNICRELGRKIHWDPKAEHFVNDAEADKLLSRSRRKGYELPKELARI